MKPYIKNAQVVLMKEGADYNGTASLIGKTVVAEQGSAGEDTINADDNLKQANFVRSRCRQDCLMELKAADAAFWTNLSKTMTDRAPAMDIMIVNHLAEEDYGVAFRRVPIFVRK